MLYHQHNVFQNGNFIFRPKVSQIGFKWDKFGTFSDQILVHFGSPRQNVPKSDLKSPEFVTN